MSIEEQYRGFVDRIKIEKDELGSKLQGIDHFIERNMPGASDNQKQLIQMQHHAMTIYHQVLTARLQELEAPKERALASPRIGEPQEIINADDDRDGPVRFDQ